MLISGWDAPTISVLSFSDDEGLEVVGIDGTWFVLGWGALVSSALATDVKFDASNIFFLSWNDEDGLEVLGIEGV